MIQKYADFLKHLFPHYPDIHRISGITVQDWWRLNKRRTTRKPQNIWTSKIFETIRFPKHIWRSLSRNFYGHERRLSYCSSEGATLVRVGSLLFSPSWNDLTCILCSHVFRLRFLRGSVAVDCPCRSSHDWSYSGFRQLVWSLLLFPEASSFAIFYLYSIWICAFDRFLGGFGFTEEDWSKEAPRILLSVLIWGMGIISFCHDRTKSFLPEGFWYKPSLRLFFTDSFSTLQALKHSLWEDKLGFPEWCWWEEKKDVSENSQERSGFCYRREFHPTDTLDLNHVVEIWHMTLFYQKETGDRLRSLYLQSIKYSALFPGHRWRLLAWNSNFSEFPSNQFQNHFRDGDVF